MNSVRDHYAHHLAPHYSWMFGHFNSNVDNFIKYFLEKGIMPQQNKLCLDLGSGSGFQSIALGQIGFDVKAIDFNRQLLNEIDAKKGGNLKIDTIHDDLLNFTTHVAEKLELIICMGDTLTHLSSKDEVEQLFEKVADSLEENGKFILSYRDLSVPLSGTNRFIPVRSDEEKIFTCFLEYHDHYVEVFDIIHSKNDRVWVQKVSSYKKIILPEDWVCQQLERCGFSIPEKEVIRGMKYLIVSK